MTPEYSVKCPDTSSLSASNKSNGGRPNSATQEIINATQMEENPNYNEVNEAANGNRVVNETFNTDGGNE